MKKKNYIYKIILDSFCLLSMSLIVILFYLIGDPVKRGFFCNDESIRYPNIESKISLVLLITYSLGIPFFLIFLSELNKYKNNINSNKILFFWKVYCESVPFLFGALISQIITDTTKYSLGRLRPNFINSCILEKPCDINNYTYIEDFKCLQKDSYILKDIRLSFMSGHSSLSAYCMVYGVFFLQFKLSTNTIGLIKPLLQFCLIILAIYTGLTRISDYKHHWSDVLFGLTQGTCVSIIVSVFISELHKKRNVDFYKPYKIISSENLRKNDRLHKLGSLSNDETLNV